VKLLAILKHHPPLPNLRDSTPQRKKSSRYSYYKS
jgi:hypothetical protein